LIFQIVIEPIMERRPKTKQIQEATIILGYITNYSFSKLFHPLLSGLGNTAQGGFGDSLQKCGD
jgi:hypothetical protein